MEAAPAKAKGEALTAVSNGLVRLHTRYYGKGPESVRVIWDADVLLALLWGGFTQVERTLVSSGQGKAVSELRRAFQESMSGEFTELVEEATGAKVAAYVSQVHLEPSLSVELFVLEMPKHPDGAKGDGAEEPS